jgi:hypothetical protein
MDSNRKPYVGTARVEAPFGLSIINSEEEARGTPNPAARLPATSLHAAVLCAVTGDVIAITGPADDAESQRCAELFSAAQKLLAALETLVRYWDAGQTPIARDWAAARDAIEEATGASNPANYPPPREPHSQLHPVMRDALAGIVRGI